MKIDLQLQLLVIFCLLDAIIASSSSDNYLEDSDEDIWTDTIESSSTHSAEEPQGFGINEEVEFLWKKSFEIGEPKRQFGEKLVVIGNNILPKTDLSSKFQEISLNDERPRETMPKPSLLQPQVWNDLVEFLHKNFEENLNQGIFTKLTELLAKCLEQPYNPPKYDNASIGRNLSFGVRSTKVIIKAILSEYIELSKLKKTGTPKQLENVFLSNEKEMEELLVNIERILWQLSFIIYTMHIIEGADDLHIIFDCAVSESLDQSLKIIIDYLKETNQFSDTSNDPRAFAFQKALEYNAPGNKLQDVIQNIISIKFDEQTPDVVVMEARTLHAKLIFVETISKYDTRLSN